MTKVCLSEEYNAKRGAEPSKTSHFRIDFSSFFHVFSEPPSRDHFWMVQAPVYTQKCDFGAIYDFPRAQKSTLKRHFQQKGLQQSKVFRTGRVLEPTWARFGAANGPRT